MTAGAPQREQARDALTELVRDRGGSLIGYATWLCGDRSEAEDLVQEALTRVLTAMRPDVRRGAPGSVEHVEAYVRRTVENVYRDGHRRRARWVAVRHLAGREAGGQDDTAGPEQASPAHLDVVHALTCLPPRQRACVALRYYCDLTVGEVADDLGVTAGTVKRHLHDANTRLARTLAPSRDALSAPSPAPTSR